MARNATSPRAHTVRKIRPADVEYGDRAVQYHVSGVHGIFCDGVLVGVIKNTSDGGYMAASSWEIRSHMGATWQLVKGHIRLLRDAKAWLAGNAARFSTYVEANQRGIYLERDGMWWLA